MDRDARIRELEAALEFYSDPSDYKAPFTGGMGRLWCDCGAHARVALGEGFPGDIEIAEGIPDTPYAKEMT